MSRARSPGTGPVSSLKVVEPILTLGFRPGSSTRGSRRGGVTRAGGAGRQGQGEVVVEPPEARKAPLDGLAVVATPLRVEAAAGVTPATASRPRWRSDDQQGGQPGPHGAWALEARALLDPASGCWVVSALRCHSWFPFSSLGSICGGCPGPAQLLPWWWWTRRCPSGAGEAVEAEVCSSGRLERRGAQRPDGRSDEQADQAGVLAEAAQDLSVGSTV